MNISKIIEFNLFLLLISKYNEVIPLLTIRKIFEFYERNKDFWKEVQ
jgi:hypothetical protein